MRSLPRNAQSYLAAIYLLGFAATIRACAEVASQPRAQYWELIVFVALAILAGGQKKSP